MALFSGNPKGGIMDVIRCDEPSYLIWKWRPEGAALGETDRENAIRWGSPIRVKEGSVAVFVYSGKNGFVQDYIVGPADTIVDTKNLPVIASLVGLAYNGGTPFQAEVYYINQAETIQTNFAVPYFDVFDPELREFSVPVAVRGTIDFNIQDYREFVRKHRLDEFSVEDLQKQIKDAVIENVKSIVGNAPEQYEIPVIQLERKISEIKTDAVARLRDKFYNDFGVYLKDISIAGLEIDKNSDGYKKLQSVTRDLTAKTKKAQTKIGIKEMAAEQKLGVFGRAAAMFVDVKEGAYARRKQTQREYSKEVETELAGKVGAAGAKIISALGKKNKSESGGVGTPPPIPTAAYHVVIFGQPAGPYDMPMLKKMVREGSLKPESLVWTDGMDNWAEAKSISGLKEVFEADNSLPPIPKQ